jgi:hypothetical protein
MPQTPRRLLIGALRQACLVAPLLIGLSQPANAYTWLAVDLNKDISTTEAWYNVETNTTWKASVTDLSVLQFGAAKTAMTDLNYFGTTGWRLPSVLGGATNVELATKGELGLLVASFNTFTDLSHQFVLPQPLIENLFWYGDLAGSGHGYLYFDGSGISISGGADFGGGFSGYAWAVHDGDLRITTSVPEPHESTMLLAGVLALGFMARRRRASDKSK